MYKKYNKDSRDKVNILPARALRAGGAAPRGAAWRVRLQRASEVRLLRKKICNVMYVMKKYIIHSKKTTHIKKTASIRLLYNPIGWKASVMLSPW